MKTQHFSTKTVGLILLTALLYSQSALANVQNELEVKEHSDNVGITISVILFIIGFSVLIALKVHDDKKHSKHNQVQMPRSSRYGQKHQYNH